jgi:hypothetical protein
MMPATKQEIRPQTIDWPLLMHELGPRFAALVATSQTAVDIAPRTTAKSTKSTRCRRTSEPFCDRRTP